MKTNRYENDMTRALRAGADPIRHEAADLLEHYYKLHDGLTNMIEGGRLTEASVPVDYRWLVTMLCQAMDKGSPGFVPEIEGAAPVYVCDNCERKGDREDFVEAKRLNQRLAPGGVYTDVECPDCGALAFPEGGSS